MPLSSTVDLRFDGAERWAKEPQVFAAGRITVLVGGNGSGKSYYLERLASSMPKVAHYVDAARSTRPFAGWSVPKAGPGREDELNARRAKLENKRPDSRLVDRISDLNSYVLQADMNARYEYWRALEAWVESGKTPSAEPRKPTLLMDRLCSMVRGVLPHIELSNDEETSHTFVRAGTAKREVASISDGEAQVIAMFEDLVLASRRATVICVDEPELHLHPDLADRVWTAIENELTECSFIYATHNLAFAMRPCVGTLLHVDQNHDIRELKHWADLPRATLGALLGATPAMANGRRVLFVEGKLDGAFDSAFYEWILAGSGVTVRSLERRSDVVLAMKQSSVLKEPFPNSQAAGIVDRDGYPEVALERTRDVCVVTELNEAEGYLCLPDVLCAAQLSLGERPATVQEVEDAVLAYFDGPRMKQVALDRTDKRPEKKGSLSMAAALEEEEAKVRDARDRRDIHALLQLSPCKELCRTLASKFGLGDEFGLLRAVAAHVESESIPKLAELKRVLIHQIQGA